jgi:hypothetical protein
MKSLARNNMLFRLEQNYDVNLALSNLTNLLKINLEIVLCHAWGIAVGFEKDFSIESKIPQT